VRRDEGLGALPEGHRFGALQPPGELARALFLDGIDAAAQFCERRITRQPRFSERHRWVRAEPVIVRAAGARVAQYPVL